jgi:hypothetical protein
MYTSASGPVAKDLLPRIERREVIVGVLGLGYVGLPLALAFAPRASQPWAMTSIPARSTP